MKKILLSLAFIFSTITVMADDFTITYNLTGCVGDEENPTTIAPDDQVELNFTLQEGYKWDGMDVSITMGETSISDLMADWNADPAYYTEISDGVLTINLLAMAEEFTDDVVVNITTYKAAWTQPFEAIPGVATFEEVTDLDADSKYAPWEKDGSYYWTSGDYTFVSSRSWSGMMNDGFYIANYTNVDYTNYTDDYKAITMSAKGGSNYCSVYYGGSWGGPCEVTFPARTLTGTFITNTINPIRCIEGKSYSAAFADGDYLKLIATGSLEGETTGSVEFYLADYRDGKTDVVRDWQWFDLSALGKVDKVAFSMDDSQNGAGVGHYFCIDNFGAEVASISKYGIATYTPQNDVAIPEGVEVYYAKSNSINGANLAITKYEGTTLAAGEGVILKGAQGVYEFEATEETAENIAGNALKGYDYNSAANNHLDAASAYILVAQNGKAVLSLCSEGNLAYGKAYLPAPVASAPTLQLVFEDATGIKATDYRVKTTDSYNLQGQKVDGNFRGIVIKNGKKVMIK